MVSLTVAEQQLLADALASGLCFQDAPFEAGKFVDSPFDARKFDDAPFEARKFEDRRQPVVRTGVVPQASGSARVTVGTSDVVVSAKAELGCPSRDAPHCGRLEFSVEASPTAANNLDRVLEEQLVAELGGALETIFCGQPGGRGALADLASLCITEGRYCWVVYVMVVLLHPGGNLLNTAALGVKAALRDIQVPIVKMIGAKYDPAPPLRDYDRKDDLPFSHRPGSAPCTDFHHSTAMTIPLRKPTPPFLACNSPQGPLASHHHHAPPPLQWSSPDSDGTLSSAGSPPVALERSRSPLPPLSHVRLLPPARDPFQELQVQTPGRYGYRGGTPSPFLVGAGDASSPMVMPSGWSAWGAGSVAYPHGAMEAVKGASQEGPMRESWPRYRGNGSRRRTWTSGTFLNKGPSSPAWGDGGHLGGSAPRPAFVGANTPTPTTPREGSGTGVFLPRTAAVNLGPKGPGMLPPAAGSSGQIAPPFQPKGEDGGSLQKSAPNTPRFATPPGSRIAASRPPPPEGRSAEEMIWGQISSVVARSEAPPTAPPTLHKAITVCPHNLPEEWCY